MKLKEKLKKLQEQIKALAEKSELSEEEAKDLEKLMNEAKAVQLQIAGLEMSGDDDPDDEPDEIDEKITKALDPIVKALEQIPGLDAAKYLTHMGGNADPENKSFGDFLLAVKRGDGKRLREVYKSTKTLEEDSGAAGGYLVPEDYRTDLLQMAAMASQVVPLVRRIPVTVDAGSWPALDQFAAPTAGVGETAFAAGAAVDVTAEGGTLPTDNDPSFEEIQWRVHKVGDIVPVTNELNDDSPQSIEALLRSLFGVAIAAKEEYFIFRGTGAAQPLGILNADAAIGITPGTNNLFSYADALGMISRFKSFGGRGRFFMHPGVFPDIGQWEIGTAGAGAPKINDLGYGDPIYSEHLPQDDNAGDVVLADLSAYLFFDRQGLTVDFSEHAYFTTDRVAWRFKERLDGQPWMKGAITLADPQGSYTVSPYVYHND